MIENIIRINRTEFDRLSALTERKGYIAWTYNIATQDLFPLHKIHYVFQNIHPGEIYEVDTIIEAQGVVAHLFKMSVFYKGRCIGLVTLTMKNYDPATVNWETDFKVKAIQRGKEQWLREVGLMTSTISMAIAYSILNANEVFVEKKGKHHITGMSNSDSDELIYSKLKAYIYTRHEETHTTGTGHPPAHEFDVRGHWRHYKSGKVGWVSGYTKCKGRGTKIIHEYVTGEMKEVM